MALCIGSTTASAVYLGTTAITRTYLGPTPIYEAAAAARVTVPDSAAIGASSHSLLYQAIAGGNFGNLGLYRGGEIFINFMEYSSLKERWDANGLDRTASYDGALLVAEIGDPVTGLANPDSAQGIETLQHLYWYALTAQAKGCALMGIYPPHMPEGSTIPMGVTMGIVQYWVDWLRARPEITIPVYAIPVPIMVAAMADLFAPASIYTDGLHLRSQDYPAPNQMNNAMGQVVRMFLTGVRPENDAGWNATLISLVDAGWNILQQYEITGFGGPEVITPVSVASDPLPDPLPLPTVELSAPVRVSAPTISGILQVGETLTLDPVPVYSGNPAPTVIWRWQSRPNGGGTITTLQTGGAYTQPEAQAGRQIRAQDMASNSQGSTGWTTNPWSDPVAAAPVDPEPEGYEDMETASILFIGNSMTDSLFSGSADARQTLGKSHATAPQRLRKFTIPGSTQGITWDQRNGAPGGAAGPAGPYDPADSQTVAYPGRDMAAFDAVCWSSAGPFPQLPDPDYNNDVYRDERDHFRLWSDLCDLNGVRKYFLTFPPATDWASFPQPSGWPALTDPDVYERFLTSMRMTTEEWVAEVDPSITIIPKTELWREIHRRCVAGTFPGVTSGSTTPALQNDPPEMGLVIHPTHLGSIFEAVFVWRFLHGAHMDDARIADMLDDGSYTVTVAQVKEIVDASLDGYKQGSGFGITPPRGWTRPAPYADFEDLAATAPALAITGNPAGFLTAGNHAIGNLTGPVEFYALLDIEFAEGSTEIAPLVSFYEDQGGIWDAKYVGVTVHNGISGLFVRYLGQSKTQAFTPGARQVWEFVATPERLHLHTVSPQEAQSSPSLHGTAESAANRFGINAHEWTDGSTMIPETFAAGHRIHRGLVYTAVPYAAERLRLQSLLAGAYT